jgi:TRAP-type C4-dicarboxylate transport system substrate-binding protein
MRQLRWLYIALAAFSTQVHAQDKPVDLKLSLWIPPAHSLVPSLKEWGESLTKATGGTVKVTTYPSEQLGKAIDHYDMARDGIAELTLINPGYQTGRFPIIAIAELPFLFSNATSGARALHEWYEPYATREMKDVKLCLALMHDPGTLHMKTKKVVRPDDLKGMKIRPGSGTVAAYLNSMGATTVQAALPEVRELLDRGVADGFTFPWDGVFLIRADSLVKYHMDVAFYVALQLIVMNRDVYNGMSANQKKGVDEHCSPEWSQKVSTPWAKREEAGKPKMAALPGHEVYKLSPDDLEAWRKAAAPIVTRAFDAAKKAGANPDKALDELKAILKKHDASYQ